MGAKLGPSADNAIITTTKSGIRQIRIAFPHIFCMCIIEKPVELG